MAVKALGAINPAATTWTQIYTTGASGGTTTAVVSTLSAVNTGTTRAKIRLAHRVQGATLDVKHYIEYDIVLEPAGTNANSYKLTGGIALEPGAILQAYADTANVAFIAWGEEN